MAVRWNRLLKAYSMALFKDIKYILSKFIERRRKRVFDSISFRETKPTKRQLSCLNLQTQFPALGSLNINYINLFPGKEPASFIHFNFQVIDLKLQLSFYFSFNPQSK